MRKESGMNSGEPQIICRHCGRTNESEREACWACFKPLSHGPVVGEPYDGPVPPKFRDEGTRRHIHIELGDLRHNDKDLGKLLQSIANPSGMLGRDAPNALA